MDRESADGLARIDHFVVLMMENRSFDQMLGRLYGAGNPPPYDHAPRGQPFDGVVGRGLSNPIPPGSRAGGRSRVDVGVTRDPTVPDPDPGEDFPHVQVQLYGGAEPLPSPAPMDGFVRDYIDVLRAGGRPAAYDDFRQIMDGFAPDSLPVISGLARAYAVCDRWHCSVPTQTFANRSFAAAGSSSGLVNNQPYLHWLGNDVPTIFNRIEEAGRPDLTWRVYYDALEGLPLTWMLFPRLRPYLTSRFATMGHFWRDVASGRLPSLALIEPRMLLFPDDQHPPYSIGPGERLIAKVYRALRAGPGWERTLFVLTYDEHGGCYDHVPPPPAVPPTAAALPGQLGFQFDRLGVRVPAVLVSPWIEAGTVFRARDAAGREIALDHTSILASVSRRFRVDPLTLRDAGAPDVGAVLSLPRPRADRPLIRPRAALPGCGGRGRRASRLMQDVLGLLAARLADAGPGDGREAEARQFLHHAWRLLRRSGA